MNNVTITPTMKIDLADIVRWIESCEERKQEIADQIKDAYKSAEGKGFEADMIKKVIKLKKLEKAEREYKDTVLDLYMAALDL